MAYLISGDLKNTQIINKTWSLASFCKAFPSRTCTWLRLRVAMLLLWRFSLIPDMVRVAVLMESREKPPLKYSPQTKSKLGNWGVRFETLRMLPEDIVFPGRESLIYSLLINTLLYGTLC